MKILAFCSALNCSYIALEWDDKQIFKTIENDENYHSLYILNELKKMDFNFRKLDFIAVNTGVGSFSGIRVALTIAKVIASEINIPIVPLTTSEILLDYYKRDILLMDARRDMYFVGDIKETKLVQKSKINEYIKNKSVVCDKRCKDLSEKFVCFEDEKINVAQTLLKIAKDKYNKTKDKADFHYMKIDANYVQTPPIFGI